MKHFFGAIFKSLGLIIGVRQDKYIKLKLCDFSGQGRNSYGK